MVKVKRNYEIYIILDGNFEDPALEEIISKYEKWLVKNGAEILNIERIGRRRMAYAIKKKQNGFYVCYEITAPAGLITKLEKNFRLDENIIRYLSVFMNKTELKEKDIYLKKKAAQLLAAEAAKMETAEFPEDNGSEIETVGEIDEKKKESDN